MEYYAIGFEFNVDIHFVIKRLEIVKHFNIINVWIILFLIMKIPWYLKISQLIQPL